MIAIASGRTAPVCLKARSAITRPAAARSLSTANGPAFAYAPRACADWRRSGRQQSHEVNTHGRRRSRCRCGLPPAASGSAEACPSRPACCRRAATRQAAPGRKSNSRDNSSQPGALALAWPRMRAPAPGSPGACLRPDAGAWSAPARSWFPRARRARPLVLSVEPAHAPRLRSRVKGAAGAAAAETAGLPLKRPRRIGSELADPPHAS
jgi:hypothetical protein